MRRSVLLVLLIAATAIGQEADIDSDRVYPSEDGIGVVGITPEPATPVILQSAVNYWKMNESGTDDRVDSIGTNDLTANEAITTTTGKNNTAANFDSATHSLIDTSWTASGWTGFTLSIWLKRQANPSLNAWAVVENVAANPGWATYTLTNGRQLFIIRNQALSTLTALTAGDIGTDSGWVHVCGTWEADDNARIYIDGTLTQTSGGTMDGTVRDVGVGIKFGSAQAGGNPWSGTNEGYIDEVAIFDTNIGQAGCSDIYDAGAGKFWP